MPWPVDNSDRGEGVANVPKAEGARDESAAAWFAFRDEWTPMLRGYFRRLPCTRAQRDELVMDVLVDAFAAAHEGSRGTTARETIRVLARQASAQFQRLLRHEVQLDEGDALAANAAREAAVAARERLWTWLETLLERLPNAQRIAIERRLDGVPDAVIAQEAGCAVGSVPVLRARGMRQLRRMVAESPPSDDAAP